jgi:hypothetical protein
MMDALMIPIRLNQVTVAAVLQTLILMGMESLTVTKISVLMTLTRQNLASAVVE